MFIFRMRFFCVDISLFKSFRGMVLNPLYIRVPQTSADVVDDFHLSKRVPIYGFRHGFMTCSRIDWNAHFDLDHANDLQNPVCESLTSIFIRLKPIATYKMKAKFTILNAYQLQILWNLSFINTRKLIRIWSFCHQNFICHYCIILNHKYHRSGNEP